MTIPQKLNRYRSVRYSSSLFTVLVIVLTCGPLSAQQAKINYVYDDLGRLVRIIDENGNAATYHYDAVGNLLRISRETALPRTAAVSTVSPNAWNKGTSTPVTITGYNFGCSSVTTATGGVTLANVQISLDQIVLNALVSTAAPLGTALLDLDCDSGLITTPITIIDGPPSVFITAPAEGATVTEGSQVTFTADATDNVHLDRVVWTINEISFPPILAPPYDIVSTVPLNVSSFSLEVVATDSIGQTASAVRTVAVAPDPPPVVAITSPAAGINVIEDSTVILTAGATDNNQVTQLVWSINGIAEPPLTVSPYEKVITVPTGVTTLRIQAIAVDDFGRTGMASVEIAVVPGPRTTVAGRVLDANNQPLAGASVKVFDEFTSSTEAMGTFAITDVPAGRGPIFVSAEAQAGGMILRGTSAAVAPVVGGTTDVGTITLRPVDNKTYPGRAFLTGDEPISLSVGDVNGDGKLDVVTANRLSSDISVLLGSNSGSFLPEQRFVSGDGPSKGPRSIALGDLNGDNKVDLVAANPASGTVSVLFGSGDGIFQTQQRFSVGDNPVFVAVADVNADGKLDILAANQNSGDVSVLVGDGAGLFPQHLRFTAGDGAFLGPLTVVAGDVNGDGRLDIISRISASNDLSIMLGNGDGTFRTQLRISVDASPLALGVTDVNGDGTLDIVVTTSANTAAVFLGHGDTSFQTPQAYAVGATPSALAVVDMNGDNRPDIATANLASRDISVLLGHGDGTFHSEQRFSAGLRPSAIIAAKLDNDSTVDFVLANAGFDNLTLLYGNGNGTFRARRAYPVGDAPQALSVVDFNGDGKPDIAAANRSTHDLSLLLGVGDGSFQIQQRFAVGRSPVALVAADLNADGQLDVLTANSVTADVSILLGNGEGAFQMEQRFLVGDSPSALAVADFNGDGKLDVAAANVLSRDISVLLANGDGTFQAQQRYLLGYPFAGPNSIIAADLNEDGRPDLVAGRSLEGNGDSMIVFIGNGDGTFQLPRPFQGGIGTRSLTAGDFNGDGIMDVAAASTISNDVTIFFGAGDGTLQLGQQISIAGGDPSVIFARDVNGDGQLDLIVANTISTVAVLHGTGNGTFEEPQYYTAGFAPRSLAVADLNGDGELDIVTADEVFDEVSVLLRQ